MKGVKFDGGKLPFSLLPVDSLEAWARALAHGRTKYGARNWEKGLMFSQIYEALFRHMTRWWAGEDIDPDSGLHHTDCIMANAGFLAYHVKNLEEFDDRPTTMMKARELFLVVAGEASQQEDIARNDIALRKAMGIPLPETHEP